MSERKTNNHMDYHNPPPRDNNNARCRVFLCRACCLAVLAAVLVLAWIARSGAIDHMLGIVK